MTNKFSREGIKAALADVEKNPNGLRFRNGLSIRTPEMKWLNNKQAFAWFWKYSLTKKFQQENYDLIEKHENWIYGGQQ